MKGTIDVQIKHKDGSVETRHEHNVVFDLQALQTKKFYSRPYGPLTGCCGFKSISKSTYVNFSLSTMELDLTRPSVAIPALDSITSGSSSVWYTAPITSTIEDKLTISSATWTVSEALTLKSIFFPYSSLFFAADPSNDGNKDVRYRRCILTDDGLFVDKDCSYRLLPISTAFKFTNNYLHGFANEEYFSQTDGERAFVPYKLHDPTERFLFDTVSDTSHYRSYYPYYSTGELQIKDAATNTVKRSFNLTQFANFSIGARRAVRVINTGSKNFLLEPISTADGIRVWEIPDAATTETIQPSGMILADKDIYVYDSSYFPQGSYSVADNVLIYLHQSKSSVITCAKINDDLSVDIVPGVNAAGISVNSSALTNNDHNDIVFPYINSDSPWLYRVGLYPQTFQKGGTYYCRFFNSTAANFSTPIVLAEGDVLTVSYKIEVS